jgi:hypothetical protein
MLAYWRALAIMGRICYEWCSAVYLGRKPVPGGVINVFLGLDNIFPSTSTIPESKIMLPIPTLFALPSMPMMYLPLRLYFILMK